MTQQRHVRVKIVRSDDPSFGELEDDASRLRETAHASLTKVVAVTRLGGTWEGYGVLVTDWFASLSMADVMRGRRNLSVREVVVLLEQIAPAVDAAHALGVKVDLSLPGILLTIPGGSNAEVWRSQSLTEWAGLTVKLNPLGRIEDIESSATWAGTRTQTSAHPFRTDVAQLGAVVFELLGGTPRSSDSVATLTKDANRMLRRCRTPGEFADAAALLVALREVLVHEPAAPHSKRADETSAAGGSAPPTKPAAHNVPPAGRSRTPGSTRGSSSKSHGSRNRRYLAGGVGLVGLLVVVAVWSLSGGSKPPPATSTAVVAPVQARAAVPRLNPPENGKGWVNSLGMEFAPMGNAHLAVFKTRVRDFAEFVKAKNYDAEGGVYSWQRDGLKLHGHSWRNPGFPQTPDHPVVAVSWEDANQFCEWLTQKERSEGTLTALQFYRLPTDREWDAAVGLADDPAGLPESRSGKAKDVYPWGGGFPPSLGAGNYAGAESRVDVPENWVSIPGYRDEFPRTRPASATSPNDRGFCDLGGNAWEWCDDLYNDRMRWRVLRGASWATSRKEEILSSFRQKSDPNFRHDDVGFRCVVGIDRGKR